MRRKQERRKNLSQFPFKMIKGNREGGGCPALLSQKNMFVLLHLIPFDHDCVWLNYYTLALSRISPWVRPWLPQYMGQCQRAIVMCSRERVDLSAVHGDVSHCNTCFVRIVSKIMSRKPWNCWHSKSAWGGVDTKCTIQTKSLSNYNVSTRKSRSMLTLLTLTSYFSFDLL